MFKNIRILNCALKVAAIAIIFAAALITTAFASVKTIETEIMVACIYNFARFTSWPPSDNQPHLNIAFTGDSLVATSMNALNHKQIEGKTIMVEKFAEDKSDELQIIFVSSTEAEQTQKLIALYEDKPVLTISDQPGFVANGGMIELFFLNNKIRFKINNRLAHKCGIKISSQVLNLAHEVIK